MDDNAVRRATFIAHDEQGTRYVIHRFQEREREYFQTRTFLDVKKLGQGLYEIIGGGLDLSNVLVRSEDPEGQ